MASQQDGGHVGQGQTPNAACWSAASSGADVWAGAVAGGSTPRSWAHGWHRARLWGSPPLTAALLPGGRERFMLSLRRGNADFSGKLAPTACHYTKFVPARLPLAWQYFRGLGHFWNRGWEELPAPLQVPGTSPWTRRAQHVLEDNGAAQRLLPELRWKSGEILPKDA